MKTTTIVLALLLAATACGRSGAGGVAAPRPVAYATGANDLVLRVTTEGGFVAPATLLGSLPDFSLFGDGTVIAPGVEPDIFPGQALPPLQRRSIDPKGAQAILAAAMHAGLGRVPDMTGLGSVGISDMPTTVFTLNAGGLHRTVKVYALDATTSRPAGMPADEYRARRALGRFVGQLARLESWLPRGSVGRESTYVAGASRIYATTYRPQHGLHEPPVPWPPSTPLPGVGSTPSGYGCTVVGGREWTSDLQPLAERANQLTPWISEGSRFALVFRPLLPDEHGC